MFLRLEGFWVNVSQIPRHLKELTIGSTRARAYD